MININENKISIELQFKDYEFRRVTRMGEYPVLYTTGEWINKEVLIIPVPYNVTDRLIEKCYDEELEAYKVSIISDTIIKKRVGKSRDIGRIYVPKDLLGLDCLIIKAPILDNF